MCRLTAFLAVVAAAMTVAALIGPGCSKDKFVNPDNQRFDYADTEVVHLVFQITPTFLPDTVLYKRLHRELQLVRDSFPDMAQVTHFENRPAGRIVVQLTANAATAYEGGTYHGLDSLIDLYDTAMASWTSEFRQLKLYFVEPYYPDSAAARFLYANGVEASDPVSIPGDSSRIFVDLPDYEFQFRWGDCLAGCAHRHSWFFSVTDNAVDSTGASGDPLPDGF